MLLHFYCSKRTQVGLEDILQTLTSADVDLESFTPPLLTNVSKYERGAAGQEMSRTLDSALGLRSCAADIFLDRHGTESFVGVGRW